MRRAAKIDDNQPAIIKALHRVSVSTEVLGKPLDLLVWARATCPHCDGVLPHGETSLLEVKNPDGKNEYTKGQVEFIARWPGRIIVARSEEEAIRAVLGEKVLA